MEDNKKSQKVAKKYCCIFCDYNSIKKNDFEKHLLTPKHINNVKDNDNSPKNSQKIYECYCGNIYKFMSGLCKHKKICTFDKEKETHTLVVYKNKDKEKESSEDIVMNNALIVQILQENKEMMSQIMTLVASSLTSVTNNNTMINNNVQNKQFNLNVYLNETCKDAMNIEDFVKTMVITNKDLDYIGYEGFVVVISRVIVREMSKIEEHLRPFHCTDKKRESFYIKTVGEWKKDSDDRILTITFVKTVANICFRQLLEWKKDKANIKWNDSSDKKHDHYNAIMTQIMNCTIPEGKDLLGIEKVIRNFIPISLITKMKYT